jgi:hypothetical protein
VTKSTCFGLIAYVGRRATFHDQSGCADASVLFSAAWFVKNDQLRFTKVQAGDFRHPVLFSSKPWRKIG